MTPQDLEIHLHSIFNQARIDLEVKAIQYMKDFARLEQAKKQDLQDGKITQEEFDEWRKNKLLYAQHWDNLVKNVTDQMLASSQIAVDFLNNKVPAIFAQSYNQLIEEFPDSPLRGYSFELVDANAVKELATAGEVMLPPPGEVDEPKNITWNAKQVNAQILQGILQGESIPKMAARIAGVTCEKDLNVAIRNARTMTTAAENCGRQSGLDKLQDSGAIFKKKWIAATDERTRETHILLNGKEVNNDEAFRTVDDDDIRFPGDWTAPGKEVWNCRCALGYRHIGFKPKHNIKDMSGQYSNMKINATKKLLKTAGEEYSKALHQTLNAAGLPSEMWASYLNGSLDTLTTQKINAILMEFEAVNPANKVKDLANQLANFDGFVYNNIWKDPVKPSDYALKKDKIQAKKDYFNQQLTDLESKFSSGLGTPEDHANYSKFLDLLASLDEFEAKGKEYEDLKKKFDDVQNKLSGSVVTKAKNKILGSGRLLAEDYSEEAKRNAKKFTSRIEADRYHRPYLDSIWSNVEDAEKYAVWQYTLNSNPMNKPLSGYHERWSRSYFYGLLNTDWGNEDAWRSIEPQFKQYGVKNDISFHKVITDLTKAIEKSTIQDNVYLVRGDDLGGVAGLLEGDLFSYDDAFSLLSSGDIGKMKKALVGNEFQNHAFTSTGIATGTGFIGKDFSFTIYAPKGTKGIYAEPQSHWGASEGNKDKLYRAGSSYSGVGSEAEIIIQRGTKYRITNIEKTPDDIHVTMEVVEQPDYFVHGDENTADNGATRHDKGRKGNY